MSKSSRRESRRNRLPRAERPGPSTSALDRINQHLVAGDLTCDRCGHIIGYEHSRSVEIPTDGGPVLLVACEACVPHLMAVIQELQGGW